MYKGTTPTFIFTFTDFDPTTADDVILTFSQDMRKPLIEIGKEDMTIESDQISIWLSQEETLSFPMGRIFCQFNFLFGDGQRVASAIKGVEFNRNLHNEVMT